MDNTFQSSVSVETRANRLQRRREMEEAHNTSELAEEMNERLRKCRIRDRGKLGQPKKERQPCNKEGTESQLRLKNRKRQPIYRGWAPVKVATLRLKSRER